MLNGYFLRNSIYRNLLSKFILKKQYKKINNTKTAITIAIINPINRIIALSSRIIILTTLITNEAKRIITQKSKKLCHIEIPLLGFKYNI